MHGAEDAGLTFDQIMCAVALANALKEIHRDPAKRERVIDDRFWAMYVEPFMNALDNAQTYAIVLRAARRGESSN